MNYIIVLRLFLVCIVVFLGGYYILVVFATRRAAKLAKIPIPKTWNFVMVSLGILMLLTLIILLS